MATTPMQQIRELVEPAVASAGCELWDLSLSGPAGRRLLRVYIDAPGGVDLERCARVSRTLRPALDVAAPDIDLEVSSPGAERPLRGRADYLRYIGSRVRLRARSGEGEQVVEGQLVEVDDLALTVGDRQGHLTSVPTAQLLDARLAVEIGAPSRPRRKGAR